MDDVHTGTGGRHCYAVGCTNGDYKLSVWPKRQCKPHYVLNSACKCPPPFELYNFPTKRSDPEGRKRWLKAFSRADPKKPHNLLEPKKGHRVCSIHFVDGVVSQAHPDPELHLGHAKFTGIKRSLAQEERHVKRAKYQVPVASTSAAGAEFDGLDPVGAACIPSPDMPHEWCAVDGCKNSTKGLKIWKETNCPVHLDKQGQGRCVCQKPFRMKIFPADLKIRQLWVEAINKVDRKSRMRWQPRQNSRVCSEHFAENENVPTLKLGKRKAEAPVPVSMVARQPAGSLGKLIFVVPPALDTCKASPSHLGPTRMIVPQAASTLKVAHEEVKGHLDVNAVGSDSVADISNKKRKTESDPLQPFSNVMPVPFPFVQPIPVDLGRVKTEPEEPVPVGLYTSVLNSNHASSSDSTDGRTSELQQSEHSEINTDSSINKPVTVLLSQDHRCLGKGPGSVLPDSCQSMSPLPQEGSLRNPYKHAPRIVHQPVTRNVTSSASVNGSKLVLKSDFTGREFIGQRVVKVSVLGITSSQTDITGEDLSKIEYDRDTFARRLQCMSQQLSSLQQKVLDVDLSAEALSNNCEKVKFYTGFANFRNLMNVFNHLESDVNSDTISGFPKFKEFFMTMIILRLNISFQNLSDHFNCPFESVVQIFEKWINVMDSKLKSFIVWPAREKLKEGIPEEIRQICPNNITVIVDFCEIPCDEPSLLSTENLTRSDHNPQISLKFMLGFTPDQTVTFVSGVHVGNTGSKFSTQNCDIQQYLQPGDLLLSGTEFSVDGIETFCAEVRKQDPSLGGLNLLALDLNKTLQFEHLHDCVRNVAGRVKTNYQILQRTFPCQRGRQVEKIVRVCCALNNLSDNKTNMEGLT